MNIIENSVQYCINFLSIIRKIAAELHLTPSQMLCIYVIPFRGITQSDLAKKLSIDISTLSRNLDKLIIRLLKTENIFNVDQLLDYIPKEYRNLKIDWYIKAKYKDLTGQ